VPTQPLTTDGKLSDLARHVVVPSGLTSTGWPAVRNKCLELGIRFDPWQDGTGRIILSKRADGSYATSIGGVVLSIPRQVGKTFLVGAMVFALCLLFPGLTVIWTAHHLRTSEETFAKMQSFARRRKIAPHVDKVVLGSGDEAVEFKNGSRILFGARSRGFGRGFDLVDVLVFDEAQILTENAIDDMVPATNQSPNPLLLFMGTPPKPSDPSEVFTSKRAKALSGSSDDMGFVEFSADEDADPDDPKQWAKGNPSYPKRTPASSMRRMRENLTDESYMREAMGVWDTSKSRSVIDTTTWASCADDRSLPVQRYALGVDVSPDRSMASVSFAGQRADGTWHVELDEQRHGVGWVVDYVTARCERNDIRAVVIDERSPAASFIDELAKRKVTVTATKTRDLAMACGSFYDGTQDGWLHHINQPQFNAAVDAARKRPLGDAWAWNRKNASSDITPLVAATLALWGAQTSSVKKPVKRRTESRRALVA
jgi:phage terminase large subunit-like protein